LSTIVRAAGGSAIEARVAASSVGGVDDAAVLEAAVAAAVASGYRRLALPPGQINLRTDWDITSVPTGFEIVGSGPDTVLNQVGATMTKASIHVRGSDGTKVALAADLAAGAVSVTLPTAVASTLAVGDIVGLESTLQTFLHGGVWAGASEIHKVIAVSGTTITLDGPLIWPYTTSATAVCWRMAPLKRIAFRNFTMTSTDPLNGYRGIFASKIDGLELTDITVRDSGGGLQIFDCIDSLVSRVRLDRLPQHNDHRGYGVAAGGRTARLLVENLWGRSCRHVFTTLGDERTDATVWGGPRDVIVRNGVGETNDNFAIWDTHPHGWRIVFDNCIASGGAGGTGGDGFQVRCKYVSIVNPVVHRCAGSGIQIDPTAESTRVTGGELAWNTAGGSGLGPNSEIFGVNIHDNTGAGVVISGGAQGSGSRIINCRLERNTYGVQDQTSGEHTGIVVSGNYIPKSTGVQNISLLNPKSDLVFAQNILPGYGSGADGVSGTVPGTVSRTANIVDA